MDIHSNFTVTGNQLSLELTGYALMDSNTPRVRFEEATQDSCAFNGTVPNNRDQPILFNLDQDPTERVDVAKENPDVVGFVSVVVG